MAGVQRDAVWNGCDLEALGFALILEKREHVKVLNELRHWELHDDAIVCNSSATARDSDGHSIFRLLPVQLIEDIMSSNDRDWKSCCRDDF